MSRALIRTEKIEILLASLLDWMLSVLLNKIAFSAFQIVNYRWHKCFENISRCHIAINFSIKNLINNIYVNYFANSREMIIYKIPYDHQMIVNWIRNEDTIDVISNSGCNDIYQIFKKFHALCTTLCSFQSKNYWRRINKFANLQLFENINHGPNWKY